MPDQAGTWLGTRRAKGLRRKWMEYLARAWKRSPAKGRGWQVPHCANTFLCAAFVAVWHAVRIFRTACRPGHEAGPACEAARRVGAARRACKCQVVKIALGIASV